MLETTESIVLLGHAATKQSGHSSVGPPDYLVAHLSENLLIGLSTYRAACLAKCLTHFKALPFSGFLKHSLSAFYKNVAQRLRLRIVFAQVLKTL